MFYMETNKKVPIQRVRWQFKKMKKKYYSNEEEEEDEEVLYDKEKDEEEEEEEVFLFSIFSYTSPWIIEVLT